MKINELFSVEELSLMETLEIKGGASAAEASQTGCSNNAAGCACQIIIVKGQQQQGVSNA